LQDLIDIEFKAQRAGRAHGIGNEEGLLAVDKDRSGPRGIWLLARHRRPLGTPPPARRWQGGGKRVAKLRQNPK
jgi:hypothetical protein